MGHEKNRRVKESLGPRQYLRKKTSRSCLRRPGNSLEKLRPVVCILFWSKIFCVLWNHRCLGFGTVCGSFGSYNSMVRGGDTSNLYMIPRGGNFRLMQRIRTTDRGTTVAAVTKEDSVSHTNDDLNLEVLYNCVGESGIQKSSSSDVIEFLRRLEEDRGGLQETNEIPKEFINGTFELIFSSSVSNLPLGIGTLLDGYMPNKETIVFDLEAGRMSLSVETLPFLPSIDLVGEKLSWEGSTNTLQYTVQGKDTISEWNIIYADDTVVAGKSSVTGYNVLRRCQ